MTLLFDLDLLCCFSTLFGLFLFQKTSMIGSDYFGGFDNGICEDDSIDHMLNFFDMPMESLEGDGTGEDWFEKFQRLGPIPTEVLSGSSLGSQGKDGDGTLDMQPMPSIPVCFLYIVPTIILFE